jgi:hypothetical protein
MLSADGLVTLLGGVGLEDVRIDVREIVRSLAGWLDQTDADDDVRDRIVAALRADADGGPPTGFAPRERAGEWEFVHTVASVTGRRPDAE